MPSKDELDYLDFDDLVEINRKAVELTKEEHFFDNDDERRLRELLAEVRGSDNEDPDRVSRATRKASLLFYRIASLQSFHEGNKRTALVACDSFLRLNHLRLSMEDKELLKTLDRAAISAANLKEVHERISSAVRK